MERRISMCIENGIRRMEHDIESGSVGEAYDEGDVHQSVEQSMKMFSMMMGVSRNPAECL